MFFIPGWLISILTFPGVIIHEIAHRFFCDISGVPVYNACYFRVGNPAGYVVHGPVPDLRSAFLISAGPLLLNTVLCAVLSFAAVIPIFMLHVEHASVASALLLWVGISIGMHAFPSNEDMENFSSAVNADGNRGLAHTLANTLSAVFGFANLARVVWFDAIYAFVVAIAPPWILLAITA